MNNDISKDYIETEILSFKWMDLDQTSLKSLRLRKLLDLFALAY